MTASAIPAAWRRLYDEISPSFADTATVFLGPPTSNFDGDAIAVGFSPSDTIPASSNIRLATTALGKDEEFDIVVAISVYGGDEDDYISLIDRALSHADVIASVLDGDQNPAGAGTAAWAYIASTAWTPGAVDNGVAVGLDLHIRGTARI